MGNAATSEAYRKRWEQRQHIFSSDNLQDREERSLPDGYRVQIDEYACVVDGCHLRGSSTRFLARSGAEVARWRSVDNSSDFYKVIRHSNGRLYLIFRQDLYGYSLLDMESKALWQFYPEASLNGEETFIWTDVDYHIGTDILVVSGCYWGSPYSIQLFRFDQPLCDTPRFLELFHCLEGSYNNYGSVDFVRWVNDDLCISCYVTASKTSKELVITKNDYRQWLANKGEEL